jgi:hypothetical protein
MRRLLPLLLLVLSWSAPALASDPLPMPDPPAQQRGRMTTEQRFQAANRTQDGRLTLEQAKQGYKTIARHFEAIDATSKGFVTLDDIRAWQKAIRDARLAERAALEDPLRPRQAIQRTTPPPPPAPVTTRVTGADPGHGIAPSAEEVDER